jgi:GNAT superfamily N-acetyltransferase
MSEAWMPRLSLRIPRGLMQQLPRHPSYRYEVSDDELRITPRARYCHARLDLASSQTAGMADSAIRPLEPRDWGLLPPLFRSAFAQQEPFASAGPRLTEAVEYSLDQTRIGGDGPLVDPACLAAEDGRGGLLGAALVTLVPNEVPSTWAQLPWGDPEEMLQTVRGSGFPHLTWIFVAPSHARHGVGTRLLAGVARQLLALGHPGLLSTMLVGNDVSILWHWRNGFKLLSSQGHPGGQDANSR